VGIAGLWLKLGASMSQGKKTMSRIAVNNQLLEVLAYLPIEKLEQTLDFVLFLKHRAQELKQESLKAPQATVAPSLRELLLQGPTLTEEECRAFEENRQWMASWKKF
jgi:hypothetical protein